jgi:uncharacterized protein (DUF1800 family)
MDLPRIVPPALACLVLGSFLPSGFALAPFSEDNRSDFVDAPHRTASPHHLQGDRRIVHALNRFTFGPQPGEIASVRAMGLDNWFEQQLHPERIDQSALNTRLAQFPVLQWSPADVEYRLPSNATLRQLQNSHHAIPADGILHAIYANQQYRMDLKKPDASQNKTNPQTPHLQPASASTATKVADVPRTDPHEIKFSDAEITGILALSPQKRVARLGSLEPAAFESFIHALHGPQRQTLYAGLTAEQRELLGALENPEREVTDELIAQRLTRDIYSSAQLQEVMTDFWFNHFNIYLHKNEQMPYYLVGYERDTLRPHALGKFEDLLEAVAHSPAMLLYLDNANSMGPDSPDAVRAQTAALRHPAAQRKAPEGLNENYARELMELHTLGVSGGYTQADVLQVARVLTGWTVDRPQSGGGFVFLTNHHEPGTKIVLGRKIDDVGEAEGRALLHMLAMRPATAHFLAHKLAVRFVGDTPPRGLEDRLVRSYLSSGGDISAMLRTLFHSHAFWSEGAYRAKVKTPLEFVVSAVRASNAQIDNLQPLANALRQMGMPLYGAIPPTGYKWDAADWVSTAALVDRMNFALNLTANHLPGIATAWSAPAQCPSPLASPDAEEARIEHLLIAGNTSDATRSAAIGQFEAQSAQLDARNPNPAKTAAALDRADRLIAGLLLGSPEFQRR